MNAKTWLVLGACFGALAVGLGAFGAHGLPKYFEMLEISAGEQARRIENWEVAARYHMYHALAMVAVGLLADRKGLRLLDAAGIAFFFGTLLFSGCLYAWALTGTKTLIHIVPFGGALFIVGWVLLAVAGSRFFPIEAPVAPAEETSAGAPKDDSSNSSTEA